MSTDLPFFSGTERNLNTICFLPNEKATSYFAAVKIDMYGFDVLSLYSIRRFLSFALAIKLNANEMYM